MKTNVNLSQFTANQIEFIEWLAAPEFAREIATQRDLAKKLSLREETLSRWKQRLDINKAVEERKRELMGAGSIPKIIDALVVRSSRIGQEHDLKAANKAAEILLDWYYDKIRDKGKLEITGKDGGPIEFSKYDNMTDEELIKEAEKNGISITAEGKNQKAPDNEGQE